MNRLLSELRHAARSLVRAPGFSLAVVATLALALGPGVALLSMVEQIFWRPLPLPQPERLVVFDPPQGPYSGRSHQWSDFSITMSYPEYEAFADWPEGPFEGVVARAPVGLALTFDGNTEEVTAELVSGNYFDVLGVHAAAGRLLAAADDVEIGGHPVVALSWGSWQRRFGGDPDVVGSTVSINGHPMTILGVAERDFVSLELGFAPELWLPMKMKPVATPLWNHLDEPRSRWLNIAARLAPGVTRDAAETLANQRYRRRSEETLAAFPAPSEDFSKRFVERHLNLLPGARGRSDLRGDFGNALFAVLGLVGLLLALACANLANLFAARATRHERELTVRLALGSSRAALVRRLVVEALLLASVAAAAGLALVAVSARTLPRLLADQPGAIVPAPSATLVACAAVLAALAALGAGLLPAITATRGEVAERLRATAGAAFGGRRGARVRRSLVAVQVALSAIILVLAGLLVRSLDQLTDRHPGYEIESVLTFKLDPRLTGLSVEAEGALVDRLEEELATLPGVVAAARGETPLLEGSVWTNSIDIEGYEPPEEDGPQARFDTISTNYLDALRLPLLAGRGFRPEDRAGALPVALVNEKFVRDYLPEGDPVGRRVRISDQEWLEIVGVVGNALSARLREDAGRFVYRPYAQFHDGNSSSFYLRTAGDPAAIAQTVRRRVQELAPGIPVVEMRTLEDQARRSLRLERLTASVASALGALAAVLAAIGLYGVLSYAVDSRRRELALRAALGAAPRALGAWVVAHAALPVGVGLAAGAAIALAAGGLVGKLLYGVAPRDPATLAAVIAGLLAIAALAAAVPARRALAVEPAAALREE